MKISQYTLIFLLFSIGISAQTLNDSLIKKLKAEIKEELRLEMKNEAKSATKTTSDLDKFQLHGYAVANYYNYDYDTDPSLKDKIDAERLNIYPEYQFNDWIAFRSEIEFEHGGTGASIEYDTQEEFGEFEQEIEKGGSIKLEQIYVDFAIKPYFNIKAGRLKLLFNLAQSLDDPDEYFTTHRQEMENEIFPLGWYETGISFYGTFAKNRLNYIFSIVNGLDSSGFSSRGWIKRGYQEKFEMVNAESFATMVRLDYKFGKNKHTYIGVSGYIGDSAANRPKTDMKETAYVTIAEAHFTYNEFPLRVYSSGVYGNLENSNIVSIKNASLSNNLGVVRTPVGKNAVGFTTEIGYEVLHHFNFKRNMLYPFLRYDYYDTMYKTEGSVIDNNRWERSVITGGLNWFISQEIIVKAQYSNRRLGSQNYDLSTLQYTGEKQKENTFSVGLGFEF